MSYSQTTKSIPDGPRIGSMDHLLYCGGVSLRGVWDTISLRKFCVLSRMANFDTRSVEMYYATKLVTAARALPA